MGAGEKESRDIDERSITLKVTEVPPVAQSSNLTLCSTGNTLSVVPLSDAKPEDSQFVPFPQVREVNFVSTNGSRSFWKSFASRTMGYSTSATRRKLEVCSDFP